MAVTKITWENKEGIQNDESIPRKNKVMDDDMNEIKQAVNNNADELNEAQENISNLQDGQGTANADITSLKNRVTTLETDNTQNKADINTLKNDNETNKSNIQQLQNNQQETETNIETLQGKVTTLETDNTQNKADISTLKSDNTTNKSNIENLQENDATQNELISKLKSALINVETEEAKSLHIEDASEVPAQLKVMGNQEQDGEPSPENEVEVKCLGSNKNLLHMQEKSYTQLGVNVTQKESCLKLDGTTNGSQNILSGGYVDIGNFKKGKYSFKAHMSGDFERQSGGDFAFYIRKKSDTSESYGVITGSTIETGRNSFIFELTEDTDLVIQIWSNASGIIFNNFEMKLKVEEGETATGYSPYRTR